MSVQRIVSADESAAAEACAQHILAKLSDAARANGQATLAISGGSSPKPVFALMAAAKFDWSKVHLFWVDERCVPPTDPASNYRFAKQYLIDPAGIPPANEHRILGEGKPAEAATTYTSDISAFFALPQSELPAFDVIHRGMGPDTHTASLFPGDPLIDDRTGIAAATFAAKFNQWRVTLLPGVLLAAKHTVVYSPGSDKAEALTQVFGKEYNPKKYPSQLGLQDPGDTTWFLT
jgi:6-phosphogluconolactonase